MPSTGRVGHADHQDWRATCKKAVNLLKQNPNSKIMVASDFKFKGLAEVNLYEKILRGMGVRKEDIIIISEGYETISQLMVAFKKATELQKQLIVISTFLHFPRVWWLTRGKKKNVKHKVVFGIPRPKEAVVDVILAILFPIIDLMGLREWFQDVTTKRRMGGKPS